MIAKFLSSSYFRKTTDEPQTGIKAATFWWPMRPSRQLSYRESDGEVKVQVQGRRKREDQGALDPTFFGLGTEYVWASRFLRQYKCFNLS